MADQESVARPRPALVDIPGPSARGARSDAAGESVAAPEADDASSIDHVQEKGPPPLTKRQKIKRHYRKWWWAHLLGLIIFLAIILPILFEVIVPAIIQNVVNGQDLPVNSGQLRAVSPTQLNFTLNSELDTPLAVTIDDLDLELYLKDTPDYSPFLQLTLPKKDVEGKTEIGFTNQTITVQNQTELVKWFSTVFEDETTEIAVRGKPKIHLGALDYDANLDKTIKIPALNYLSGFGVRTMEFMVPADERGYNLRGELNLPNACALDLYLGNTSFTLLSGEVTIGLVHLYNAELKTGMNNPYFDGQFYFNELVPNLGAILESQADSLSKGVVTLHAKGNTTMINGEHIEYVEKMLGTKRIPFEVPVISLFADVLNGLLDSEGATLTGLIGETFGNETLIEQLWDNWGLRNEASDDGADAKKRKKRGSPRTSMVYNMLRMGLMNRRK